MNNPQDEIERLNKEIIKKDSAIAKLEAECREINIERLQVKTDKYWSEFELQSELAEIQSVNQQLLKTLASRDKEIETLKQELSTLRGVEGVGRNTERV